MTTQENLTPEQSLVIIQDMIGKAKKDFMKNSFFFLMWGGLMFLAGISEYILMYQVKTEFFWIGWPIMGVLGGIASGIYTAKQGAALKANTFTNTIMEFLWGGFVVTLILIIVSCVVKEINPGPYVLLLTGLPTFVSGGIIKFKPLMFGGVVFWIMGMLAMFVFPAYSSLLFSLAILLGYIVPGVLLKRSENVV